ncbi:MAG: TIGR03435 family protein [Bacteroidota bacterium]
MKTTLLFLTLFSGLLAAQPVSSPATPTFEVVSIRRHIEGRGPVQIEQTPDGFRSIGLPMLAIFQLAYPPPNQGGVLRGDRIEGDPGWLSSELYDVVAKIHQADIAEWRIPEKRQTMLRTMLQAMLVERCKVVAHYGNKETPVYDLVVVKGGPKFKRAETVDPAELRQKHPAGGLMRASATMAVTGPKTTEFYAISMATFANTILPSLAGRPVVDKTELPGPYDLRLPTAAVQPPPPPPAPAASQPLDAPSPPLENESIFAALPEWLGLRLQPAKGRVETLVIDRVERPSEN